MTSLGGILIPNNFSSCAIYKIVNIINGYEYVGSTTLLKKRLIQHRAQLKTNSHSSRKMQLHFNEYGIDYFYYEVVELFDLENFDNAIRLEKKIISKTNPAYNTHFLTEKTKIVLPKTKYQINENRERKTTLPRGTRHKLVELTGLSLNVIDNHIYGKYHNEKVEKAILKLLKRKR